LDVNVTSPDKIQDTRQEEEEEEEEEEEVGPLSACR